MNRIREAGDWAVTAGTTAWMSAASIAAFTQTFQFLTAIIGVVGGILGILILLVKVRKVVPEGRDPFYKRFWNALMHEGDEPEES